MPLTLTLAWRYFRARREAGLISVVTGFSVAGLAIGVAALILTMAVFTGFRLELRDRLFRLEGPAKVVPEGGRYIQWPDRFTDMLMNVEGVASIAPYINAPAIVFRGEIATGGLFRGFGGVGAGPASYADFLIAGEMDIAGRDGQDTAVIGSGLATKLGLSPGDEFRAYEARDGAQGDADAPTLPSSRSFLVTGIFDSGVEEVDARLILTSAATARAFTGLPADAGQGRPVYEGALLNLDDPLMVGQVMARLNQTLLNIPLIPRSTLDYDPARDGNLGFSAAQHLQLAREQEAAMVVILALIIIVAAFGVIAGQMMKVREKSREIAVLRSFGAGRGLVLRVFLTLGLMIGLLGAGIGGLIGVALALNLDAIRLFLEGVTGLSLFPADQFRLAFLPSRPTVTAVALACILALILTLLAMAYPAYRASRLSPAEALRYD